MIAVEIKFNYNNDLSAIGNKNFALYKTFKTDFLTQWSVTVNYDPYLSLNDK